MLHQRSFGSLSNTKNPWLSLLLLLGAVLVSGAVGQFIAFGLLYLTNINTEAFMHGNMMALPRIPLLAIQMFTALGSFIIGPLLYFHYNEKKTVSELFQLKKNYLYLILLTLGLTLSFMAINIVFIVLNASIKLPALLQNFEAWAQAKEIFIKNLVLYLTAANTPLEVLLAFLVITIIPAIGEELLFRGILQNILHKITRNDHWAIVISALIFSAVHFQFYGFLPRLLLGIWFGYLYWWSKNLILPILAHFFNNAVTLTLLLIYHEAFMDYNFKNFVVVFGPFLLILVVLNSKLTIHLKKRLQQCV